MTQQILSLQTWCTGTGWPRSNRIMKYVQVTYPPFHLSCRSLFDMSLTRFDSIACCAWGSLTFAVPKNIKMKPSSKRCSMPRVGHCFRTMRWAISAWRIMKLRFGTITMRIWVTKGRVWQIAGSLMCITYGRWTGHSIWEIYLNITTVTVGGIAQSKIFTKNKQIFLRK